MAGDVIFPEGGETASTAARQIERARVVEHQLLDQTESLLQREQIPALGRRSRPPQRSLSSC